ncbi:MAG: Ig-like domain repeat protein [Bryobacterales bacterium]|nr:Ig-like domain repeat protein [Bryobacterales bacterium]
MKPGICPNMLTMATRVLARCLRCAAGALLVLLACACWPPGASAADLPGTETALISSLNPSTYAQSVTFTATVSGAGGTPTGTVQFLDGVTALGTAGLSNGIAQLSTTFLAPGSHTITAVYSGDAGFAGSSSPPLIQVVNPGTKAPTSTSLLSSRNPSNQGAAVTLTATVFAIEGTPTGTVTFRDGAATLGVSALTNRRATFTTSALSPGSHALTAVYNGDGNYEGSFSPVLMQEVTAAAKTPTSVGITSSRNPAPSNQPVTLTAVVTGAGGTPTGTVRFEDSGMLLGEAVLSGGRGSVVVASFAVGTHHITARYGGDQTFADSLSPQFVQVVTEQTMSSTTTLLSTSVNPSTLGQPVTFTATVSSGSGTPTGTVQFYDAGVLLGSAGLSGGSAQFTASSLSTGTHAITAVYGGDSTHLGSTSGVLTQTVNLAPGASTTTALTASASQSTAGQEVVFTATVTSRTGTPAGAVRFVDGSTLLGVVNLAAGQAQYATSSLFPGTHLIRAIYTGDDDHAGSSSVTVPHTVLGGDPRPVLTSSANPAVRGQPVTFEAQLYPDCDGMVAFTDGAVVLGSVLLESGGRARLVASRLSVGVHQIAAVYTGGAVCPAATSIVLSQTVQPAGTATAISAAASPSGTSGAFILTATTQVLPPGAGTPSGEVVFRDGEAVLGVSTLNSGGVATLAVHLPPASSRAIFAEYAGNAEFASSASVRLTDLTDLSRPDFEASYVVNSASFATGLAPGTYATIFGSRLSGGITKVNGLPYPDLTDGVWVTLNGEPVQLVYLSDQQINFVVPAGASGDTANIVVSTPHGTSKTVAVPLVTAAPGVFADPVSGYGAILVAGTAETTRTRAVRAGEYLEIYCTGLGAVDAAGWTLLPVTVRLGSSRLNAAYSGLNSVFPGLYQVNVQVPQGPSGELMLSIEIDGRRSNEVKVRVQ